MLLVKPYERGREIVLLPPFVTKIQMRATEGQPHTVRTIGGRNIVKDSPTRIAKGFRAT